MTVNKRHPLLNTEDISSRRIHHCTVMNLYLMVIDNIAVIHLYSLTVSVMVMRAEIKVLVSEGSNIYSQMLCIIFSGLLDVLIY